MDRVTSEQRRKIMQAIKGKGTQIENALAKALWAKGFRYRRNSKYIYGKPDISFKKYKLAIFCDSEFWHGKDWEVQKNRIKSNKDYWFAKIERNILRDKEVNEHLTQEGWVVLRFWGKSILKDVDSCVKEIADLLSRIRTEIIG
jgi:DNA mismatch endonuclease Vsr